MKGLAISTTAQTAKLPYLLTYYILVSLLLRIRKMTNSTAKMMMAVASEARKVDMEMPEERWPVPLCESIASPTPAILEAVNSHTDLSLSLSLLTLLALGLKE